MINHIKSVIMSYIREDDTLVDQQELAHLLDANVADVDKAYDELALSGAIHAETYHLWKCPKSRRILSDAMCQEAERVLLSEAKQILVGSR